EGAVWRPAAKGPVQRPRATGPALRGDGRRQRRWRRVAVAGIVVAAGVGVAVVGGGVAPDPVRRAQRREAVGHAGGIALAAGRAEYPRGRHVAAGLRAQRVDAAAGAAADVGIQRDAARAGTTRGAAHGDLVAAQWHGQGRRYL